jgi:predicted HicB family RNase H-like nuclease
MNNNNNNNSNSNKSVRKYCGRITLRTSSTLHKRLIGKARDEKVSLNLLINQLISEGLRK